MTSPDEQQTRQPGPCPDCEKVERAVIIGAALAGALMGAGLAFIVLSRAK